MYKKLIVFAIICVTLASDVQAARDTTYLPDAFYKTFKSDLPVYSGRLFSGYLNKIKGSPFIAEEQWQPGTVLFDDVWYKIDALKYDTYTDELLVLTPSKFPVKPAIAKTASFSVGNRIFIKIDSLVKFPVNNGFYEVLEEGYLSVYAKRKCVLDQHIEQLVVAYEFNRVDEFYVVSGKKFARISSKKDLYKLVKDKKKSIKKVIRSQKLNFKRNREALIIAATEAYNKN